MNSGRYPIGTGKKKSATYRRMYFQPPPCFFTKDEGQLRFLGIPSGAAAHSREPDFQLVAMAAV